MPTQSSSWGRNAQDEPPCGITRKAARVRSPACINWSCDATEPDVTMWRLMQPGPVTTTLTWGFVLTVVSRTQASPSRSPYATVFALSGNDASDATPLIWAAVKACRSVCGPTRLAIPVRRTIRPAPCRSSRRPPGSRNTGPCERARTRRRHQCLLIPPEQPGRGRGFGQGRRCGHVSRRALRQLRFTVEVGRKAALICFHQPQSRPWRSCRTGVIRSMSFMTEAFSSWLLMIHGPTA
jgi:hypothetical protein